MLSLLTLTGSSLQPSFPRMLCRWPPLPKPLGQAAKLLADTEKKNPTLTVPGGARYDFSPPQKMTQPGSLSGKRFCNRLLNGLSTPSLSPANQPTPRSQLHQIRLSSLPVPCFSPAQNPKPWQSQKGPPHPSIQGVLDSKACLREQALSFFPVSLAVAEGTVAPSSHPCPRVPAWKQGHKPLHLKPSTPCLCYVSHVPSLSPNLNAIRPLPKTSPACPCFKLVITSGEVSLQGEQAVCPEL